VRALARGGALDIELDVDMGNEESGALGADSDTVSEGNAATSTTDVEEHHDVPDEAGEVRVYVFAGQGRRGVDSLVSRRPRLE
jgi:hypothetical protein